MSTLVLLPLTGTLLIHPDPTSRFEYLWQDSENFKRPTKMSAPDYVEHLMAWVQSNIDNEHVFPSRIGMHRLLQVIRFRFSRSKDVDERISCFLLLRRSLLKDLSPLDPTDLQTPLSGVRSYLLPSLRRHRSTRTRTSSQHQLQTLCALHR